MTVDPTSIEADRATSSITIAWDDGRVSTFGPDVLRWACPCAVCQGEWGRPGLLSTVDRLPPDELVLEDLLAVGSYAVTPVWRSGHASGIYSFEYLRKLDEKASGQE
ncbi:MAG TPA: DUF971 domain-containing protein [Chloroflexota bacterium]